MKIKVLEFLIDNLIYNGFDTFFLVTGGAIAPTVDYIGRNKKAKYFCFQHEQSAAMAAEGFFRASGKMGIVLATSGPGAQNLLNGICGCWYESIPCLFITGQVNTHESLDSINSNPRQVGFQETPVSDSFKHFTKFSKKINDVDEFEVTLKKAIISCFENRPGPSIIDIPFNIQNSYLNTYKFIKFKTEKHNIQIKDSDIKYILDKLKISKRPLLILGHGVKLSNAQSVAEELVNLLNIPFVLSWGGFDIITHDHPNFIGDIGVYGSRGGNYAIQNCDFLISIGSRLDTRQTGGNLKLFSRESCKVMVDIDEEELNKDRGINIDLKIKANANDFILKLKKSAKRLNINNEWKTFTNNWKSLVEKRKIKKNVLTSYEFLEELNSKIPTNSIIVPDQGGNLVWSMQSIKIKKGQKMFSNFGNSSMGYALPAAIGASISSKNPIFCIDGDGGFQMNIQELQTVNNYKIPVKIIILNNRSYGIIKQFQDSLFDSRYIATDGQDYSAPDFVKIGMAYGIESIRATKKNFKEVINYLINSKKTILIDVIIDKEQKLIPKLEYGNALENMTPYTKIDETKKNMIVKMAKRF
tara:strand:- start:415 stop:2166 length:1752 start_codon:yes stop_codon:yes gene_type:complete